MRTPYRIQATLGSSHNTNPEDVWATKHNLKRRGYYVEPTHGMNEFPDRQFFNAIRAFQRHHNLRIDGVMRPDGETERHLLDDDDVAVTYWCTVCGAPHGGVYSPRICWQCWDKGYR